MIKLTPKDCVFDIVSRDHPAQTHIQLFISPTDEDSPVYDGLSIQNLTTLPEYLANLPMHAENLWDWEGDAPRTLAQIHDDMVDLGYTYYSGICEVY